MSKNENARLSKLNQEIKRLKQQIENLKKENKKLKSNNKTLSSAWRKSEEFVKDVTEGRSVLEIIKDVNIKGKLSKIKNKCSKCDSTDINILKYLSFRIAICHSCKFKEKIDGEDETN